MRAIQILQSIFAIGVGFYLGTYFGHLMDFSPIVTGLLAGGICMLAIAITTPIIGIQK